MLSWRQEKILKPLLAAAVVFLSLVAGAVADPIVDAHLAYQKGDYATAIRYWRPLAGHRA